MRNALLLATALCALAATAWAGDCFEHPVTLEKGEILSCEPLSRANAAKVSRAAKGDARYLTEVDGVIKSKRNGVVVTMKVAKSRVVHIDDAGSEKTGQPRAEAWVVAKKADPVSFFAPGGTCDAFPAKSGETIELSDNCECDTGPHGICVIDHPLARPLASGWAKFAAEP